MKKAVWIAALAAGALWAAPATAQTRLKPGLWELSTTMKSQSGQMEAAQAEMQKALADMPPAQRKQMEQMMAQRGVGMGAGGAQLVRICMTQQQVERDEMPQQPGCTHSMQRVDANTLKTTFNCRGEPGEGPTSGEGLFTIDSPSAYRSKSTLRMVQEGRPEQIDMSQQGRWLGADCGQVKPMQAPKR